MGTMIELTGQKYGRLTVLNKTTLRKNGSVVWHCKCDCGKECDISSAGLRSGSVKSCGCLKKESDRKPKGNVKDETGKKYGHLTVIERIGSDKNG